MAAKLTPENSKGKLGGNDLKSSRTLLCRIEPVGRLANNEDMIDMIVKQNGLKTKRLRRNEARGC